MLTLLSGILAGAAHVVTGPDHLAALAPIAVEQPRRAAAMGFRWGLGHGVSVVIMGCVGLWFRAALDLDVISRWAEVSVGFLLVAIGSWALLRATRIVVHTHPHDHEDDGHAHLHVHSSARGHELPRAHLEHNHAAFFIGALHGAAGTGHLFGLLPALALPLHDAVIYLCAYLVAAVAAMTGFGGLLGMLMRDRGPTQLRRVMLSTSLSAMTVGVYWIGTTWPT